MSPNPKLPLRGLLVVCTVFSAAQLSAQFDFGGSCLDMSVTLTIDPGQPTLNGKPFYIGTGDFTEPGQPTETLNFEVFWDVAFVPNAWVFANGGFVIAENDDDTPEPPLSSTSSWLIITGGPETCPATPLTVAPTAPTPVTLTGLSAKREGTAAILSWGTASETDNVGFTIERSTAAAGWAAIGFVDGAGTSTEPQQYAFTDMSVPSMATYYRLRQLDGDGSVEYSDVVSISSTQVAQSALLISPNPSSGNITLTGAAAGSDINVYDPLGRRVFFSPATGDAQALPLQQLFSGVYIATVTDASGSTQHVSFTIQ